ncbi:hypothetical protein EWZ93_05370 [Helicobacter pylori]|nr:hypothetical protein [Helicobacter pylori]
MERCRYSLILVARVFKFFNTAFWVIVWLVFSFYEKNSQNSQINENTKNNNQTPCFIGFIRFLFRFQPCLFCFLFCF